MNDFILLLLWYVVDVKGNYIENSLGDELMLSTDHPSIKLEESLSILLDINTSLSNIKESPCIDTFFFIYLIRYR